MINTVQNIDFLENSIPAKSIQLLIVDPPYFRVRGDFDFIWESFEHYLEDVEKWAKECVRILADNGSMYWYGDPRKIAYTQIILDRYFSLINCITWHKGDYLNLSSSSELRSYAPSKEAVLFYEAKGGLTNAELIREKHLQNRNPIARYLRDQLLASGKSQAEIAKLFPSKTGKPTGCVSNWCKGKNNPSLAQYLKIKDYLGGDFLSKSYRDLLADYQKLYYEYQDKRRFFTNELKLTDVLEFSNESNTTGAKYDHETVKPETLTRALILTSSKKGDTVGIPFAGSGTECAMAIEEGRKFYACEIVEKHVKDANKRVQTKINNLKLF